MSGDPSAAERKRRLRALDHLLHAIEEWNFSGAGDLDALCARARRLGVTVEPGSTGPQLHEAVTAAQLPWMDPTAEPDGWQPPNPKLRVCSFCLMVLPTSAFPAPGDDCCRECHRINRVPIRHAKRGPGGRFVAA